MSQPVFRFAPSPNGELHLGHALSALISLQIASNLKGQMLLRFDDNDSTRWREEHESRILTDLDWIGFEWNGSPVRLSSLTEEYGSRLDTLEQRGLCFKSSWSRRDLQEWANEKNHRGHQIQRDPDGALRHPVVTEQGLAGSNVSTRLIMAAALAELGIQSVSWTEFETSGTHTETRDPADWGNPLIQNRDGDYAYAFATILHDDSIGVTHVVRGLDLKENTALQRVLQDLFGISPPQYFHHQLLLDGDGQKLSKSNKSTSLRALREAGWTRNDVLREIGLAADDH